MTEKTRFIGKTVVVTGASRGQGAAEARALASEGATVIIADVTDAAGQALAEEIAAGGGHASYQHLDVTSASDWAKLRESLIAAGHGLDGLVNNAGISVPGRLSNVTLEAWNNSFAVNVTGAMLGIQTLSPIMNQGGSIVNVGSIASLIAHHNVAYSAAKWALRGLSKTAAVELAHQGIRVNMIHPGYIKTPINADMPAAFLNTQLALTPAGRGGHVDEVADLVLFLLSADSTFISGSEIPIDGGFTSHGGNKPIFDAIDAAAAN
ncbi:SDR family NAD(P)-dependent oxidoreductase [Arthrobacter sp. MA-N2]|uniref:SDR family NAD(P)-dependent oxidoreductase n=1 Tax=Arthrobacter sp. MA-N2 TaxID=1101188 RepID=UPI000487B3BB|nr:SDR family NAD(P)-dependent oxidoreductase [Arthrobacter sp. MA-N2]